jgi:hypothetical protein
MPERTRIKGKPKAWVERDSKGKFKNWVGIKRSLAVDKAKKAKKKVKPGYRGKGD